jgi:aldose 1-epimerase
MKAFGVVQGRTASLFELESDRLRATVMDYGGVLVSLEVKQETGRAVDVLLGFDSAEQYVAAGGSFGALLGRNANRLSGGAVEVGGRPCSFAPTEDGITLHGGKTGFGHRFWDVVGHDRSELTLRLVSPDGDQGLPGTVEATAIYRLDAAELSLTLLARTDAPTFLSLSSHPYFNLNGRMTGEGCLDHEVLLAAQSFLPTDARQLPTGEIRPVAGTAFDFRQPRRIGDRICQPDEQLRYGKGYDHCFVVDRADGADPTRAALVRSPSSGLALELLTTQPGVQFYSGNNLDGSVQGRQGVYRQSAGFALEPQGFPDAPHHAGFPSTLVTPHDAYRQVSVYRFSRP